MNNCSLVDVWMMGVCYCLWVTGVCYCLWVTDVCYCLWVMGVCYCLWVMGVCYCLWVTGVCYCVWVTDVCYSLTVFTKLSTLDRSLTDVAEKKINKSHCEFVCISLFGCVCCYCNNGKSCTVSAVLGMRTMMLECVPWEAVC